MTPWDILGWAVAVAASIIVLTVATVVVIAGAKAVKRVDVRRRSVDR